jgi:uncharacterized C2H2 Zn-finger protein
MIQTQYKRPAFTTPPSNEKALIYKCDLCNTFFRTDEKLSDHVKTNLFNKRESKNYIKQVRVEYSILCYA